MHPLDWAVVAGYLLVMLGIGVWAHRQVAGTADFFTAGGRMPWWLAGISHHMSGYSAVVFVAYAGVAYEQGIVSYVVFMFPLAIATGIGAFLFAPKWNRLRLHYGIASPLEYLARRFNVTTQQVLAWSGSRTWSPGGCWTTSSSRTTTPWSRRGLPRRPWTAPWARPG